MPPRRTKGCLRALAPFDLFHPAVTIACRLSPTSYFNPPSSLCRPPALRRKPVGKRFLARWVGFLRCAASLSSTLEHQPALLRLVIIALELVRRSPLVLGARRLRWVRAIQNGPIFRQGFTRFGTLMLLPFLLVPLRHWLWNIFSVLVVLHLW
jgi:hypothetical protein